MYGKYGSQYGYCFSIKQKRNNEKTIFLSDYVIPFFILLISQSINGIKTCKMLIATKVLQKPKTILSYLILEFIFYKSIFSFTDTSFANVFQFDLNHFALTLYPVIYFNSSDLPQHSTHFQLFFITKYLLASYYSQLNIFYLPGFPQFGTKQTKLP